MDWLDGGEDLLTAQRERDKPRQSLKNNTAGVREREDENRTREAGNRDEVEGVVANTLNLLRNGAVGFIEWLGGSHSIRSDACRATVTARTISKRQDP